MPPPCQYAEAFRRNAITALDLPLLVTTNALEEDLGVASALHRKQIQRAIKRMILGVCSPPGAATNLTCTREPPRHINVFAVNYFKLEISPAAIRLIFASELQVILYLCKYRPKLYAFVLFYQPDFACARACNLLRFRTDDGLAPDFS